MWGCLLRQGCIFFLRDDPLFTIKIPTDWWVMRMWALPQAHHLRATGIFEPHLAFLWGKLGWPGPDGLPKEAWL